MNIRLKRLKTLKKKKFRDLNPNYTFSAPPYDVFSAFQPGGYYRVFHRVQAEKMKKSYNWIYSEYEVNKSINITDYSIEKLKYDNEILKKFLLIDALKN